MSQSVTIQWTGQSGKLIAAEISATSIKVTVDGKSIGRGHLVKVSSPVCTPFRAKLAQGITHVILCDRLPVSVPADIAAQLEAAQYEIDRAAAALEANLPGLALLTEAAEEDERHYEQHQRWIASDGLGKAPAPKVHDLTALRAQYPRAACYLIAQSYANASNHHKASAGNRAARLLASGGEIEAARAILDNWLPDSAYND